MSVERDAAEGTLRDAAHDAFMAFWRGADTPDAERLWQAYCRAQARYDEYLLEQLASHARRPDPHTSTPSEHPQEQSPRSRRSAAAWPGWSSRRRPAGS